MTLTHDECVQELTRLAEHYERSVAFWNRTVPADSSGITKSYARRAFAIRWLLSLNAYGVDESEIVV